MRRLLTGFLSAIFMFGIVLIEQSATAHPIGTTITDFSVYAEGNVTFGNSGKVENLLVGAAGDVTFGNDGSALDGIRAGNDFTALNGFTTNSGNNIVTGNDAIIGANSILTGVDVIAGGTILIGATTNLPNLPTRAGTLPTPFSAGSPYQLPTLPASTSFTANNNDQDINGGTLFLIPDTYGVVDFGNGGTLELSSGNYIFKAINGLNNSILDLDLTGGDINIFVEFDVTFTNNFNMMLTDGFASNVFLETHGNFTLANGGNVFGTIYSTVGDITSSVGGNFTGPLYAAGDITFGNDSVVMVPAPVPIPATMLLLSIGLLGLAGTAVRRRFKKTKE
jgi:hypothetical protein